jgi:hypothetical protein
MYFYGATQKDSNLKLIFATRESVELWERNSEIPPILLKGLGHEIIIRF